MKPRYEVSMSVYIKVANNGAASQKYYDDFLTATGGFIR